jgi:RNA polymerase sigma-70 factor (ECF subfamily)
MSEDMTTRMPDDVRLRALMVAYQSGSLDAFDELYALLSPALSRWLRARTGDRMEAEDLLQETFLQIHRARHTYDPRFPVPPWGYAITRHVWLMHRRTRSRRPQPAETVDAAETAVRGEAEAYAERKGVRDALRSIPESRRQAVVWHHVFGLSFREIAERLRIRESAAKLRSSRGVADLRTRLGGARDEDHDQ